MADKPTDDDYRRMSRELATRHASRMAGSVADSKPVRVDANSQLPKLLSPDDTDRIIVNDKPRADDGNVVYARFRGALFAIALFAVTGPFAKFGWYEPVSGVLSYFGRALIVAMYSGILLAVAAAAAETYASKMRVGAGKLHPWWTLAGEVAILAVFWFLFWAITSDSNRSGAFGPDAPYEELEDRRYR